MDFSSASSNNNHDSALDLFEKPVFCENFQSQTDIIIQPTDFKYNLPSDCQNIFTLGVAIRKISCKFVSSNFTVLDSPSIILSDFQKVGCILYDIL